MSDEPEATEEVWTFAGSRVGNEKTRRHAWMTQDGSLRYFRPSGSYTVAGEYLVRVSRTDDGHTTMHGEPVFRDPSTDAALTDQLWARHRAAEAELRRRQRERAARRDDPVEQAVSRLAELARHVSSSQRPDFAAHVLSRIVRAWETK